MYTDIRSILMVSLHSKAVSVLSSLNIKTSAAAAAASTAASAVEGDLSSSDDDEMSF